MRSMNLGKVPLEKVHNKLYWFAGLFFVYANGSLISENYRNIFNIFVVIMLLFLLLLNISKTGKIVYPNPFILFLAFFPFLSMIYYADPNINIISIIYILITYIVLSLLPAKNIYNLLEKYAYIIFYLAIISIPLGIIFLIDYSLLSRFFPLTSSGVGPIYNLLVYTERSVNDLRVQSIYWEPGAWAVNLGFCLYWFFYIKKDNKKVFFIILAMLLVFSTSGFAMLGIILVAGIFYAPHLMKKKAITIFIISCVLIGAAIMYLLSTMELDIIGMVEEQTIEKFTEDKSGSYTARKETTEEAFKLAKENPFIGLGKQNSESSLFVTSSISEIAYQFGLLFLGVYLVIFLFFFRKMGLVFGCLFGMVMLNAEAYAFYILFSIILTYSSKEVWTLMMRNLRKNKI